jgi:hypothetical protein
VESLLQKQQESVGLEVAMDCAPGIGLESSDVALVEGGIPHGSIVDDSQKTCKNDGVGLLVVGMAVRPSAPATPVP